MVLGSNRVPPDPADEDRLQRDADQQIGWSPRVSSHADPVHGSVDIDREEQHQHRDQRPAGHSAERRDQHRERGNELDTQLNAARSTLQQRRGRQASLEALQQAAMHDSEQEVGQWLESQHLTGRPRLLETVQVDDGWQLWFGRDGGWREVRLDKLGCNFVQHAVSLCMDMRAGMSAGMCAYMY